jgi:hypothetical protein
MAAGWRAVASAVLQRGWAWGSHAPGWVTPTPLSCALPRRSVQTLALLALRVGRDADADVALRQALRYGLAAPELLTSLAVAQQQAGRFGAAAALLRRTLSVQDGVQARCRLAAILLASHEYEECQAQLVAAAALPADDADRVMLGDILQRLRDAWTHQ